MNSLKRIKPQNIKLSSHALERAKQRIDFKVDKNSLEFEFKLKELIQKATYRYDNEGKNIYSVVHDAKVYEVVVKFVNYETILILTVIPK